MLPDQANDLRQLVLRGVREAIIHDAPAPPMLVVAGAKGGVGTTTVALNLATALALEGRRTVLVDADFAGPDLAVFCGLDPHAGAAEVLDGRRTVHEVLERGPAGMQVLPASREVKQSGDIAPAALERLILQLKGLGQHADLVVVDVGSGGDRTMQRWWDSADGVLLVTHPDSVAVMDAYAAVKLVCGEHPIRAPLWTLANCTIDDRAADDVHGRIDRACRRFLGVAVENAGGVPFDPCVPRAAAAQHPLLLEAPTSMAAVVFERLATTLPPRLHTEPLPSPHFVARPASVVE